MTEEEKAIAKAWLKDRLSEMECERGELEEHSPGLYSSLQSLVKDLGGQVDYSEEEIKKARERISALVKEAYASIEKAEQIAEEFGVGFSFDLAYGMGGSYVSKKESEKYGYEDDCGWVSSSSRC